MPVAVSSKLRRINSKTCTQRGLVMTHSIRDIGCRPAKSWAGYLSVAAMLTLVSLWLSPQTALSAEKKEGQQISRVIAKEMTAAQKALQAQQWAEAIKNLEAAETKSGINAFDKKTIYDFKGFAYVKLNNLKAAEQAYEVALSTGAYTPEDAAKTTRMLFRLSAGNQQYAKAAEYGKQVAESGSATADDLGILSQIYYLQKDCKSSGQWADKAIAAARKAGQTPKENLYQFKLQCASDAGDTGAMSAVSMDLIRLTNKTNYWNTLLRIERQDERDDRNTLMIYRIMYNTNSMNADTDYIEMAQLLGDAALPGEAQAVLEKALSSGVIKDEHKERTTRLLNSLKARADTDRKGLASFDAEAAKNPAGELSVKLDEVYVYLGLAEVQLKNFAEAKRTVANLRLVPNISPRILKLWSLYAETV